MVMKPDIEGTWRVTSYRSGEVMVEPDEEAEAFLEIDGAGVGGTMGINRFAGQLEGDSSFGAMAMTRMAGPPELMLQEDILLEHLQGVDEVEVNGDGMFLRRDGLLLVELERSGTDEEPATS
jgi:heat shock protein HslJ